MHTLIAVTFPEMGRGLLAVIVFGAALIAVLAALAMLFSAMQLWRAHRARRGAMLKRQPASAVLGSAAGVRAAAR
jgi:hypothetical protein